MGTLKSSSSLFQMLASNLLFYTCNNFSARREAAELQGISVFNFASHYQCNSVYENSHSFHFFLKQVTLYVKASTSYWISTPPALDSDLSPVAYYSNQTSPCQNYGSWWLHREEPCWAFLHSQFATRKKFILRKIKIRNVNWSLSLLRYQWNVWYKTNHM